jgi:hypothetical protein
LKENNMALYAFDGTWNEDEVDPVDDTNVLRFKRAYQQQAEYIEGVGTQFGALGRLLGGIFGAGGRSRIHEMYERLVNNWKAGDHHIDIIGFSRGAALAVHFSNVVAEGIREEDGRVIEANPRVRFLGVWDVVPSFGIPIDGLLIPFHEIDIGWNVRVPSIVDRCFHALALNERRQTFVPERLNADRSRDNVEEVWFRGMHSDIGGGNGNIGLNSIACTWMLERAMDVGLPIDEDVVQTIARRQDPLAAPFENEDPIENEPREVLDTDVLHPSAQSKPLAVGDKARFEVRSREKFCWSGVRLERGAGYAFHIAPHQKWRDASIVCGPDGWKTEDLPWFKEIVVRHVEDKRRVPEANWFELIGSVNEDGNELFRIGKGGSDHVYTPKRTGDLFCFANDLPSKYGNNRGAMHVVIERVS